MCNSQPYRFKLTIGPGEPRRARDVGLEFVYRILNAVQHPYCTLMRHVH